MPGGQQNLLFGDNFVGMHPGESAYISENEYISDAPGCIPTIGVLQPSSDMTNHHLCLIAAGGGSESGDFAVEVAALPVAGFDAADAR